MATLTDRDMEIIDAIGALTREIHQLKSRVTAVEEQVKALRAEGAAANRAAIMRGNGYRPGVPREYPSQDGAPDDAELCAQAECDDCGHKGLIFEPWFRESPRSWNPFAVCPNCGTAVEI